MPSSDLTRQASQAKRVASQETKLQIPFETYKRRQKLKGNSTLLIMGGFMVCQSMALGDYPPFGGAFRWVTLAAGLGAVVFGVWLYLPIRRTEKLEREAWKRQEQAELEAANEFLRAR